MIFFLIIRRAKSGVTKVRADSFSQGKVLLCLFTAIITIYITEINLGRNVNFRKG